jgi:hypothetical protein
MAIEIVDLPIENSGSFHSCLLIYQRVTESLLSVLRGPFLQLIGGLMYGGLVHPIARKNHDPQGQCLATTGLKNYTLAGSTDWILG